MENLPQRVEVPQDGFPYFHTNGGSPSQSQSLATNHGVFTLQFDYHRDKNEIQATTTNHGGMKKKRIIDRQPRRDAEKIEPERPEKFVAANFFAIALNFHHHQQQRKEAVAIINERKCGA